MIKEIESFIYDEYGVSSERPFKGDDTCVFRNGRNKKWFAIIMRIPANRLGLKGDETIEIMNLKNYPDAVSMLRGIDGIFPAYHMNKENWLTVILNGTVPLGMIFDLIDQSYNIIELKNK